MDTTIKGVQFAAELIDAISFVQGACKRLEEFYERIRCQDLKDDLGGVVEENIDALCIQREKLLYLMADFAAFQTF